MSNVEVRVRNLEHELDFQAVHVRTLENRLAAAVSLLSTLDGRTQAFGDAIQRHAQKLEALDSIPDDPNDYYDQDNLAQTVESFREARDSAKQQYEKVTNSNREFYLGQYRAYEYTVTVLEKLL